MKLKNNLLLLKQYAEYQDSLDYYILDSENIILVLNDEKFQNFEMVHVRFQNGMFKKINSWNLKSYYLGGIKSRSVIQDKHLFKIQNNQGQFNGLYDFHNDCFVIPLNEWVRLEFGLNNEYLEKYNGFLASFVITSDQEEDDDLKYINPVTELEVQEKFEVRDGTFYAILNMDGSIRGNKLFRGKNFSKIEEIIDLDEYESLENFKELRKAKCNEIKQIQKQEYYRMIKERNNGSISPYLDEEVARIISLK